MEIITIFWHMLNISQTYHRKRNSGMTAWSLTEHLPEAFCSKFQILTSVQKRGKVDLLLSHLMGICSSLLFYYLLVLLIKNERRNKEMVRSRKKFVFKGLSLYVSFYFFQGSSSCAVPIKAHAKQNSALFKSF